MGVLCWKLVRSEKLRSNFKDSKRWNISYAAKRVRYDICTVSVREEIPVRGALAYIWKNLAVLGFFIGGIPHMSMPKKKDSRTYKDRAEYLKKAVADRRRRMRLQAIEYGGDQCQICGYKKCLRSLSFHHKDPSQKDFGLSARGLTRSWEKTKKELDKCILVCANCHMEIHEGITKI